MVILFIYTSVENVLFKYIRNFKNIFFLSDTYTAISLVSFLITVHFLYKYSKSKISPFLSSLQTHAWKLQYIVQNDVQYFTKICRKKS